MSLQNSWIIKNNNIQSWFSIHINCLKVFMSETQHQDETIYWLSFADQWSNEKSESEIQNVKWYLRSYCSYMQDDWFVWLFMTEFIDNNAISSSIEQSTFFLNKSFHSHISFNLNSIEYEITQVRIEVSKAKNIFKHMKWSLALIKQALTKVRVTMKKQINKHWKKMIYKIDDMMFLDSRNITIARSSKKLDDKMLESFKILIEIEHAYRLKLSSTMKIHSKFISNLLQLNLKNSLKE